MDWKLITNFEKKEWRTEPDKVYPQLILMTDRLAGHMKSIYPSTGCIIHVAYEESDHVEGSKHYMGMAVDCHFIGVPLFFQFMVASQFPFTGIGVYPYWKNPGLHLEIEPDYPTAARTKRWWRDDKNEYRSISEMAFYNAIKIG